MKKLILAAILSLASLAAFGQSTNIIVKVTVEELGGATNSATLKLDGAGTKRDQMMVAGQVAKFFQQTGTNVVGLDVLVKNQVKGMLEYDGLKYNARLQAELIAKLGTILSEQPELLNDGDKAQLAAIAAKLP